MTLRDSYSSLFASKTLLNEFLDFSNIERISEQKIKSVFKNHDKDSCFVHFESEKYKLNRSFHSVSVYLLGLYLLENGLKDVFKDFGISCENFKFASFNEMNLKKISDAENYLWTLTSLYHDVASDWEHSETTMTYAHLGNNPFVSPKAFIDISEIFGKEKISRTIFDSSKKINEITKNVKIFDKSADEKSLVRFFPKNLVEGYFRMRLDKGYAEHGIISGYIFYDALVKNYFEKLDIYLQKNPSCPKNFSFTLENILYRPEHLLIFKYVACSIICHNIWRYTDKSKLEYFDFGICDEKLAAYKNPILIDKNPLLFFLCLVDTIEPAKCFYQIKPKDVLSGIDIDVDKEKILLTINDSFSGTSESVEKWFDKIKSMKQWMKINVQEIERNKAIQIFFGKEDLKIKTEKYLNI